MYYQHSYYHKVGVAVMVMVVITVELLFNKKS